MLIVKNITREDPDLLKLPKKDLENGYRKIKSQYEATGRLLLTNFLNIAGLM